MYHSSIGTSGTLAPGTRVFLTCFISLAYMLALYGEKIVINLKPGNAGLLFLYSILLALLLLARLPHYLPCIHNNGGAAEHLQRQKSSGTGKGFDAVSNDTNAFFSCNDVCVISSVSDFQYRHVLLPLDEV